MGGIPGLNLTERSEEKSNRKVDAEKNGSNVASISLALNSMGTRDATNCEICKVKTKVAYICPKCKIRYCSASCYKSRAHILCSEGFFRDQLRNEVGQNTLNSKEERDKVLMKKILSDHEKKLEVNEKYQDIFSSSLGNESSDDIVVSDEELTTLFQRLGDLDIDGIQDVDFIWSSLGPKQKRKFINVMATKEKRERLFRMMDIELWVPWWLGGDSEEKLKSKRIIEIPTESERKQLSKIIPPELSDIPQFHELLGKSKINAKRNPSLLYGTVEFVFNYVFLCRHFNINISAAHAEKKEEVCDIFKELFVLSDILKPGSKTSFKSSYDAIFSSVTKAYDIIVTNRNTIYRDFKQENLSWREIIQLSLNDSAEIFSSWRYLFAAMSELFRFLESDTDKKSEFLMRKKLLYYLSYAKTESLDFSTTSRLEDDVVPGIMKLKHDILNDDNFITR